MTKQTFTLIMGIVLLGSFFLPYLKFDSTNYSGLGLVLHGSARTRFILLAIPLSALALLAGASGKGKYEKGLFHWLPIITILVIGFIGTTFDPKYSDPTIPRPTNGIWEWFSKALQGSSYGFWITTAAAIILLFGDWIATKPNK
jgi:hypothetical protein